MIHPALSHDHNGLMGMSKTMIRLSLHTSSLSPIPKSPFIALKDLNWCNAMYDEYNALVKNDGLLLMRYKARLVANGSNQQHGVDFDETFSPVVKPATIRTVLSLVVFSQWTYSQLMLRSYFLNGDLIEKVYMHQPLVLLTLVILIMYAFCKGLCYGLKHAPRWLGSTVLQGGLQYLTFTRPDLSYVVQQVCLYMHDPREPHFAALKRILRYVQGTLELGLHLYASATTSLVGAEAEYRGVANVVAETAWIRNLLRELHSPLLTATLVYCDNISVVYMSADPVQHQRTKHIEIDIHFVRDMVKAGHVRVLHVPSRFQYADIFTKGLPSALFEDFRSSLSVRPPPAPTAGAY
ncbi:ribonuclease H-like domain-containing protein [Tanacetum coccineum]|uniref:Ribonuclease H-like domain-containing protein n=1 Tax=Tanacetum coccineum TaxID=301880 RepID=A0ABQ5A7E8_9ASTR